MKLRKTNLFKIFISILIVSFLMAGIVGANNIEGEITGELVEGLEGNALEGYVELPDIEELNITGEITLEAWIKPGRLSGHQPIIAKGDTQFSLKTSGDTLEFFICDNVENVVDPEWDWEGNVWFTAEYSVSSDEWLDQWQHVVGTYNGQVLKLYLNGELVASESYSAEDRTVDEAGYTANEYPVNIGRDSENTDRIFNGLIDRVRIYNRALTEDEINDEERAPDENSVLWMDFTDIE